MNKKVPENFFNIMRIALLGAICPSIRAIAFQYEISNHYLKLRYYYDREVTDDDKEETEAIATEIDAAMELDRFDIEHVFSNQPANKLNSLDGWLYLRYEVSCPHSGN